MGRKSREKRERLAARAGQPVNYTPQVTKKKGLSNAKKILIGLTLIAVIVVAASVALSQPQQTDQLLTNTGFVISEKRCTSRLYNTDIIIRRQ